MPNLPDMPEEVLKIILKDADLRRILSLRKVCHQMRDLLDQMDFDFGIDQIQISRKLYETDLEISTGPENFLITYQWKPAESEPLGTLNFVAHSQHQVLQILPFIHSNFLETLDIVLEYPRHPEHLEAIQSIKIDKITELDQWKNAENLRIQGLIFPPKIKDFEHFELVEISIATVVEDELREIKEAFFNENSRLNCFEINYIHMDVTTLLRVFGFPENRPEDSADSENWYFPIKDDQILLKIGHYPLEDANHEQLDPIYSSILFLKCFKIPE
ncbi:hypothetical protein L3Y34_009840 [Caenorhabditis briggsae]|uniref:F-box domain-containing protein n=1 Tax=Caenorhabditis briggsae TaxID=6238 RepID=A0AAE9A6L2_CAEBR|nr:hypothetical protein L3Y34_009840 [Caenorhabditis briggsae]